MPKVFRDNDIASKSLKGYSRFEYRKGGGAGTDFAVETQLAAIIIATCITDDGVIVSASITDSTIYPGTKRVTFALPAAKDSMITISGTNGYNDYAVQSGNTVTDDVEVY